jgi:hypothetical protein
MSQQARKEQEAVVVRRLTLGVGAAALGLAGFFTTSAATAAPMALSVAHKSSLPPLEDQEVDSVVIIKQEHVPAIRPPAGSLTAAAGQTAGSVPGAAKPAAAAAGAPVTTTTVVNTVAAPAAAAKPAPKPAAVTGGTPPK